MNKIVKNIIYFSVFFPGVAMAQIRPDQQGSLDQPSVGQAFSSISTFLYVILGGMGALSIVGLLVAAIDYLVAGGDEERVGRSGKTLAFSLIGLAVAVVGIVIINIVGGALQK